MIFVKFYEFVNFREIMVVFYIMIDTVIVSSLVGYQCVTLYYVFAVKSEFWMPFYYFFCKAACVIGVFGYRYAEYLAASNQSAVDSG